MYVTTIFFAERQNSLLAGSYFGNELHAIVTMGAIHFTHSYLFPVLFITTLVSLPYFEI